MYVQLYWNSLDYNYDDDDDDDDDDKVDDDDDDDDDDDKVDDDDDHVYGNVLPFHYFLPSLPFYH